eukprot:6679355-Prymnesium_polylepis.1
MREATNDAAAWAREGGLAAPFAPAAWVGCRHLYTRGRAHARTPPRRHASRCGGGVTEVWVGRRGWPLRCGW